MLGQNEQINFDYMDHVHSSCHTWTFSVWFPVKDNVGEHQSTTFHIIKNPMHIRLMNIGYYYRRITHENFHEVISKYGLL